jgi:RNA polymerase sigma-70 factor (ECF subfamily)
MAAQLSDLPQQHSRLEMQDFLRALQLLPDEQRETLILVGASGFSYEQTAEICGVRVGTVKSRVSRARAKLEELLEGSVPLPAADPEFQSIEQVREALVGKRRR